MKKIKEEKAHAEYSASGATIWMNCPGSMALSRKAPPKPENKYGVEGTKAHEVLEFLLKGYLRYKNLQATANLAKTKFPEEMVDFGMEAARWIVEEFNTTAGDEDKLFCEEKVDTSPFICSGQFGTLDAAIVREFGRLTIIDYKYGGMAVEPEGEDGEGNMQLLLYALAVSHKFNHNFSEVELVIIQPRAFHEVSTIRSAVFTMDHVIKWGEKFREGYKRTTDPLAGLSSGAHCKWCPAAVICPEIKEEAMKNAQVVFSDTTGLVSVPEPRLIQLPNLGKIMDACERLEAWTAKVREHVIHVLEQGGDVEGFKLVQKRSTRKWIDEEFATKEARTYFGNDAFSKPSLLSPAQLEKAIGGKAVKEWVEEHVTAESSGTTLAREDDRRPAVNPIQKVFGVH